MYNHVALVASFTTVMIRAFWLHDAPVAHKSWYSCGTTDAALAEGVKLCGQNYTVTSFVTKERMRAFVDAKWQIASSQFGCSSAASSPMCYCVKHAFSKHSNRVDAQFWHNDSIASQLEFSAIVDACNTDAFSILAMDASTCVKNERRTQYVLLAGGPNVVVPPDLVVTYAWLHMCLFLMPMTTENRMIICGAWVSITIVVYAGIVMAEPTVWVGTVLTSTCALFTMLLSNGETCTWIAYCSTLVLLGVLADFYTDRRDSYVLLLDVFFNVVITSLAQTTQAVVNEYRIMYESKNVHSRQLTVCWEVALLLWICHAGVACIRLVSDGPRLMEGVTNNISFVINISYILLCFASVILYHPTLQYRIGPLRSSIVISILQSALLSVVTFVIVVH